MLGNLLEASLSVTSDIFFRDKRESGASNTHRARVERVKTQTKSKKYGAETGR